jgi:prepilin-type N-terminal cleavage/methylation domain-containing protein
MSMLSKLLAMPRAELKSRLQAVDTSAVKGRGLRRKFEKIRAKEGGFTLLELLVVVAILAAVASTTFAMLQDTDRRAAAGAHVHAMGQIASALVVYPKLNNNSYPGVWDSLLALPSTSGDFLSILSPDLTQQLTASTLTTGEAKALWLAGIRGVRGLDVDAEYEVNGTDTACTNANLQAIIEEKDNDVVPSRIYSPPSSQGGKGGCGDTTTTPIAAHVTSGTAITAATVLTNITPGVRVARWNSVGGDATADPARLGVETGSTDSLIAFGITDGVSLIDRNAYAGLAVAPIYRHVETHEYPGYIVVFRVTPATDTSEGEVVFQAVVDGAGDTREEELGELDNLRNT